MRSEVFRSVLASYSRFSSFRAGGRWGSFDILPTQDNCSVNSTLLEEFDREVGFIGIDDFGA